MAKRAKGSGASNAKTANSKPRPKVYKIEVAPAARRELKKLAKKLQRPQFLELTKTIDALAKEPRPHGVEKLADADKIYRVTSGQGSNHRIIYQIRDKAILIIVLKVSDRKEVYREIFKTVKQRIQSIEALLR